MAIYLFKCYDCGWTTEKFAHMTEETPSAVCRCGCTMVRDYRGEGAATHIPLHMSSRNTSSRSDFLPSAKDFESPEDPSGEKGMAKWKEEHKPVNSTWV